MIFDKGAENMHWRKDDLFSKWCWKIEYPHAETTTQNGLHKLQMTIQNGLKS